MKFKLDSSARNFFGDCNYTIREGILNGKGKLVVEKSTQTNWKPEYKYVEGMLAMAVDGREARRSAKANGIKIATGEL
jgi:hypothetical protein